MVARLGRKGAMWAVIASLGGASLLAQTAAFTRLKANEAEVKNQIFSTFSSGSFYAVGSAAVFKAATPEERATIVKAVMEFARAFAGTADFTKRYATFREGQKPGPPPPAQTGEQMRAEQRKGLEEAIKNTEALATTMPSMKKDVDKQVAELKANLANIGKNKEEVVQQDKMMAMMAEMQATEYKTKMAEWEKQYPVDPKAMIVSRLREFLDMSATVAFDAKTELKNKKQVFVDPRLEQKDYKWKLLYRAGKPATDAARAVAQEWLKSL